MSVQWTVVATFLYSEMGICVLLMLPFISVTNWRRIFKSRLFNALASYANLYFTIFIAILVIFFLDGVRDVWRYSTPLSTDEVHTNPNAETQLHMKLFRSQRNFYIAGFALFSCLILRRIVALLSTQAQLQAEVEAATNQAKSATAAAKQFLEDKDNKANEKGEESQIKKDLAAAKDEIAKKTEELNKIQANAEEMKQQAESARREYDRLMKEHATLQEKVQQLEGASASGSNKEE